MIAEVLLLVGVMYAVREAWNASWSAVGTRRAGARKSATARGGTHNQAGSARRAARQATAGWWAGEARHKFPTARHGFAQGWREHQAALAQRETDTAAHQADTAHLIARLRAERAAHLHRLAVAQRQGPPTMSTQLATEATARRNGQTGDPHMGKPAAGCTDPECSCHKDPSPDSERAANPPLADGATPGSPPPGGPPSTNGGSPTMSDLNYPLAVEKADRLVAVADSGVSNGDLEEATQLSDQLGGMVPSDGTTLGVAADVVTAASEVIGAHKRLMDSAAALKDRLVTTYGPTHDDVQASGEDAAQPEFHRA